MSPTKVIRKAKYCYEQSKNKPDYQKTCKDKRSEKYEQRKKGYKTSNFFNVDLETNLLL